MKNVCIKILTVVVTVVMVFGIAVISASAELPKMKRGDLLSELPTATDNAVITLTDTSKLENGEFSISWDAIDGAEKYAVRMLFNINYMKKDERGRDKSILNFLYEEEIETTDTSATVTGLQYGRRYTILLYGLDGDGNDMAVCQPIHIFTYPENELDDNAAALNGSGESGKFVFTTEIIIAIIVAATLILAVVMVLIIKKILK